MKHLNKCIYVIILASAFVLIVTCEDENYFEENVNSEELIDPHSFYYDKQSKKMIKEIEMQTTEDSVEDNVQTEFKALKQVDNYSSQEAIFYKRLINLLLSNINIKEKDEVLITGTLEIEASHSQMEILQNFHTHKTSLREIDEILSNIIKKPRTDYMMGVTHAFETVLQKSGLVLEMIQKHPDGAMIAFAILMVFLTLRMIQFGQGFSVFIFIQVIFILSFFMTWWQLMQEAEIKFAAAQMKFTNIPVACQPDKMNTWDKFVSFFVTNEDCEEYYQVKMSNPKLKITPAFALSHFITTVVLHPVTHVGTVVSGFINNATENLPWTYAWIIKCMLFLCIGLVIIIIPFCLSGASISFGLGPLLRFGINYQKRHEKGNALQNVEKRDPVQIILQVPHGTDVQQIKDVPQTEKSKALQIFKNDCEESSDTEHHFKEFYEDLSCGDTITKAKILNDDDEKVDAVKVEKNNGRGDC